MEEFVKLEYIDDEGNVEEVEVSKNFAEEYMEWRKQEQRVERKETRRHISRDMLLEKGWEFASKAPSSLEEKIRQEKINTVVDALFTLSEKQRALVKEVFYEGVPMVEIAKREGVESSAIRHRMKRIREKLKKQLSGYFEEKDSKNITN
jgi:RNA polymerase sigma factor (sigma-70 family)